MKNFAIAIIIIILSSCTKSSEKGLTLAINHNPQEKNKIPPQCSCPENDLRTTKADTVFTFGNGKKIALCGYRNTEDDPVTFSEFVLAECGKDTVLREWDATITCRVFTKGDTLIAEELYNLPVGKNFEYERTVWWIDKFYFEDGNIKTLPLRNDNIPKYSKGQIKKVLAEYKAATGKLEENTMEMAGKLFIAAVSGSKEALRNFYQFEEKYELDGAYAEEYEELKAMMYYYNN